MSTCTADVLRGGGVLLVGPFAATTLGEARGLVVEHGGRVVESLGEAAAVVVGGGVDDQRIEALKHEAVGLDVEFLTEPLFLQRLIDAGHGAPLRGLYPLTELAAVVGAPIAAVRHWWRRGRLRATRRLGRLPLFDWSEARAAKRLASLLAEGRTLPQIDAMVDDLEARFPDGERPLLSPAVDATGGRLLIRDQQRLTEPSGQVVIDFDAAVDTDADADEPPPAIRLPDRDEASVDPLREEAWRLADEGDPWVAIQACRAVLLSGDAGADDHFLLANLLHGQGDYPAARERYYAAVECDPGFVEARVNLGCLLAELGDDELAAAVLRGAVELAPDLADARFHLAVALDRSGETPDAEAHWRRFLELAPTGPWADQARDRLRLL